MPRRRPRHRLGNPADDVTKLELITRLSPTGRNRRRLRQARLRFARRQCRHLGRAA